MSIIKFTSVENSSYWDVVNNTYGSVDKIVKLMKDNGVENINSYPLTGQDLDFDDTLVEDQKNVQTNLASLKFATRDRTVTNETHMVKYEQNFETEFLSNLDGTTIIPLTDPPVGARIIYVEKEIAPIKNVDFVYNSTSKVLTLLNGNTLDNGQRLFIIYAVTITS